MQKALGLVAVALSVVALGVSLTRGGAEPAPEAAAPAPAVERAAGAEAGGQDDGRLNALEDELSRLMRRVDALERAGAPRPGDPAPVMTTEQQAKQLQALRSDVDALLTGEPLDTEDGRKRLKEVVRALQDEAFAERAAQRETQREKDRVDRIKRFIEEARLSSTQAQDLSKLLDDETAQRRALLEARRAANAAGGPGGGSGQQVREQMRTLRQATDSGAKGILSPEQYTQYEAMRSEERGGGRGAGGGGGNRRERGGP